MDNKRELEERERKKFLKDFSEYFKKEYRKNGNSFEDNIDGYNNFLLDKLQEFKEIKEEEEKKK